MIELTVEQKTARDAMIVQWMPLAIRSARRFRKCRIMWADLKQEANLGLILAVDGFDPEKAGASDFRSYASQCINNRLVDMCARQLRPFRVPAYLNKAAVAVMYGKPVSDKFAKIVAELDYHRVSEDDILDRDHELKSDDRLDRFDAAMRLLSPANQKIILRTTGAYGATIETCAAIGRELGISREAIAKRRRTALARIRQFLESEST